MSQIEDALTESERTELEKLLATPRPNRPPRDDLVRALSPRPLLERYDDVPDSRPILQGFLARFDEWTEIDSFYEGHFLERVLPGAFAKTFAENSRIRCVFQHGRDPFVGDKPLGPIEVLEEREDDGAWYEVPLLATSYNADLIPGLEADLYGSSFRFRVVREDYVERPGRSEHNPRGIAERTLRELEVYEFGPVTYPAYLGASAGLRSMTDELVLSKLADGDEERLEELVAAVRSQRKGRTRTRSVTISGDSSELESRLAEAGLGNEASVFTGDVSVSEVVYPDVAAAVAFGDWNVEFGGVREGEKTGTTRDESLAVRTLESRAMKYVRETAWAMHPAALATIKAILAERASGYRPTADEIAERIGHADRDREDELSGPVAKLALTGSIFPRADALSETSGAQSLETFRGRLRQALDDESVRAIVIDVDSPGGSVEMVPETAAEILAGRDRKPIVAVANTWAASAAYWLASAATELVVTESGEVGSIGVFMAHTDLSGALEQAGEDVTLISAGKYKTEGNPFEPLSGEAEAHLQEQVDAYYQMFVKGVAKARGTSVADVRDNFGEGRMVMAREAVSRGMADRVGTLDETIARLEKETGRTPRAAEASELAAEAGEAGGESDAGPSAHLAEADADAGQEPTSAIPTTTKEASEMTADELRARQTEIRARLDEIASEFGARVLPTATQEEWDALSEEWDRNDVAIKASDRRQATLARMDGSGDRDRFVDGGGAEDGGRFSTGADRRRVPADPYDYSAYRSMARDEATLSAALIDGARTILERAVFPHPNADKEKNRAHIERLLEADAGAQDDETVDFESSVLARRIILTGSPQYRRAFGKYLSFAGLTTSEQQVLSRAERALNITTDAQGGYAIPFFLDPSIILTSDGTVNPLRSISRVETITGNEWRGITSEGITASYDAEAQEVSDDTPTIGQPVANVQKAQAFVPFSIEVGQDWAGMQSELARLLQVAKDDLEAEKFMIGVGAASNEPEGLLVGATETVVTAGAGAFVDDDLFALEAALPERFLARASILGSRFAFTRIRQFDTNGGAAFWVDLRDGLPPGVIGYPAYVQSFLDASLTGGSQLLVLGDFSQFLIVDRVGLNIEVIPHLFGPNRRPTGQRGLYAYWRNTSKVLVPNAFRVLVVAT